MKLFDKLVPKDVGEELLRRLDAGDALPFGGACRLAGMVNRGIEQYRFLKRLMTDIIEAVPLDVGQAERALILRFGAVIPSPLDGLTYCYDGLFEDGSLICCQSGLDYGGPGPITLYARAGTQARLEVILETVRTCGLDHQLTPESTNEDRLHRIQDGRGFGVPYNFT